LLAPPSDAF